MSGEYPFGCCCFSRAELRASGRLGSGLNTSSLMSFSMLAADCSDSRSERWGRRDGDAAAVAVSDSTHSDRAASATNTRMDTRMMESDDDDGASTNTNCEVDTTVNTGTASQSNGARGWQRNNSPLSIPVVRITSAQPRTRMYNPHLHLCAHASP